MLQRKDEIYLSVNATKVKRNIYMRARLNPLLFFLMGNQQPRLEQSKVQRLSRKGVGLQAIGKPKWCASFIDDEDIVCTLSES